MKQKDLILIIVTVFISCVVSIIISKMFITPPKNRQQTVEIVKPIHSDFPTPDTKYFNSDAVDPTKNITIGGNNNNKPFDAGSNSQQ